MATVTATALFLNAISPSHIRSSPTHRRLVVTNATSSAESDEVSKASGELKNMRRDVVFGTAAAAMCSVAGIALADEPRRGSVDAKRVYAPVCVTNPTARICRN